MIGEGLFAECMSLDSSSKISELLFLEFRSSHELRFDEDINIHDVVPGS